MTDFFQKLFDTDFMPHLYCLQSPSLVWLNAVSDAAIALAYFLIPLGLLRLVQRRRDLAFHWLFVLFAIFILSCGATHVLGVVTLWIPVYRVDTLIKVVTAVASMLTAVLLIRLLPQIASLPSPQQWRLSNDELKAEIAQRKSAEASLLLLNAELERRVDQRTHEIEQQNVQLQELKAAWDLSHGLIRDPTGIISFWCEGSEQLYGWTKQEATGRNSHALLNTTFPKPLPDIENELKENNTWSGELIHTTKAGARIHVATHWILQRNASVHGTSVIEVNNDITDRIRADETAQRLVDIVESSNDAIIGTMLDGTVTSWNTAAQILFGYSAAEIIDQPIERLIPLQMRSHEREVANRVAEIGDASRYQTVRLAKDGRELSVAVNISPIRNSHGNVIGTSRIVHDISEEQSREKAFRLSEERQRLAVEAGQVGLWYLDVATSKVIWTDRCKELHGISPASVTPDYPQVLSLIHSDDREALQNALNRTLAGEAELEIDYRTRGLDYRTKWIQSRGRAQRDPAGAVIGIHGTVIDLTARRESEDKLRRLNTELEQFAYAAAHDLQEPLRNLALATALLESDTLNHQDDSQPRLLAVVGDNARRMEAMVKDLLAYSRSLDGPVEQNPVSDAPLILEKALDNLASAIAESHALVTSDALPVVSMPETHLLQIFQNLIGNALKYAGDSPPRIHVGVTVRHEDVLLFVRDNGVGIAPQFHNRVFRMFKRLHAGPIKGTGIGLAVCKRIVEHYGGNIWIESQIGEGATFFFTIPTIAENR